MNNYVTCNLKHLMDKKKMGHKFVAKCTSGTCTFPPSHMSKNWSKKGMLYAPEQVKQEGNGL